MKEGNVDLVKEHLSRGEQVGTGFHLACENGHTEIVNLLLTRDDVNVNKKDEVSQQHSEKRIMAHNRIQYVRTEQFSTCERQ